MLGLEQLGKMILLGQRRLRAGEGWKRTFLSKNEKIKKKNISSFIRTAALRCLMHSKAMTKSRGLYEK